MDLEAAITALAGMVAADEDPVLTQTQLAELLDGSVRADPAGNPPANVATAPAWATGTHVAGEVIRTTAGRYWRCARPGTSTTAEPTWPDLALISGGPTDTTVLDGSVIWADNGTTWASTWDLNAAAAAGWTRKAAAAASRFDFQTGDQSFTRSQVAASCRAQAALYRSKTAGSTPITRR